MSVEKQLQDRSNNICELCSSDENLGKYTVPNRTEVSLDNTIYACANCIQQIEKPETVVASHWRCLNDSMWSEVKAVQVVAWRMLSRLRSEGWPVDLLEMLYLDEQTLEWAEETGEGVDSDDKIIHKDSNGVVLKTGDSVVGIKDLTVKGSSIVVKRGEAVRNINLVYDNPEQIEGKVNGQQIVILTKFVKKL
jgi:protein PhnA